MPAGHMRDLGERDMTERDSRIYTLKAAMAEAGRFLRAAEAAIDDLSNRRRVDNSRAHAAAKRASMDLSNALVRVRRPDSP
jgi:hypothetical protein